MIRDVAALVVYITQAFTLLPGDVILTGTPAGVGPLEPGDGSRSTIEGIGTLTTRSSPSRLTTGASDLTSRGVRVA